MGIGDNYAALNILAICMADKLHKPKKIRKWSHVLIGFPKDFTRKLKKIKTNHL